MSFNITPEALPDKSDYVCAEKSDFMETVKECALFQYIHKLALRSKDSDITYKTFKDSIGVDSFYEQHSTAAGKEFNEPIIYKKFKLSNKRYFRFEPNSKDSPTPKPVKEGEKKLLLIEDIVGYGNGYRNPYIAANSTDNGIEHYTDSAEYPGNLITIACDKQIKTFYQPVAFSASDDILVFRVARAHMNPYVACFIATILRVEAAHMLERDNTKISDVYIDLPADENGNPDWQYMEDYIKSLPFSGGLTECTEWQPPKQISASRTLRGHGFTVENNSPKGRKKPANASSNYGAIKDYSIG